MSQIASLPQRRGAAATELAMILPLLITLCLAAVDVGRYAFTAISLGNAARVGAEWGATHRYEPATAGVWHSRLEAVVREEFSAEAGIDPQLLELQVTLADDAYGLQRVHVTVDYSWNTLLSWPMIPRPLNLRHSSVMRRYR